MDRWQTLQLWWTDVLSSAMGLCAHRALMLDTGDTGGGTDTGGSGGGGGTDTGDSGGGGGTDTGDSGGGGGTDTGDSGGQGSGDCAEGAALGDLEEADCANADLSHLPCERICCDSETLEDATNCYFTKEELGEYTKLKEYKAETKTFIQGMSCGVSQGFQVGMSLPLAALCAVVAWRRVRRTS